MSILVWLMLSEDGAGDLCFGSKVDGCSMKVFRPISRVLLSIFYAHS